MELTELPLTKSGAVRKADAMTWLDSLDTEMDTERLLGTVIPKPYRHTGSTFATPISNIRVTGTPEFITEVARLLKPLTAYESSATRLQLSLQRVKDRESGRLTPNYALYLSVAMRGREGAALAAFLGNRQQNDQKLLDALDA